MPLLFQCFESETNQERKKHCTNQRSDKSFLFTFMFFEKKKVSTASNSDYGVLCLAPSLTTFFPNYQITESCVMRLQMIRRGHTEEENGTYL